MNTFKIVREFFWPLLEKGQDFEPENPNDEEIALDNSRLQETFKHVMDCYKSESERSKTVEGKASLFIGTITVVTSVVVGVTSILVKESDFSIATLSLILLLSVLILYMSRTLWFSIKSLERKNFYSLSANDFLSDKTDSDYFKNLINVIVTIINKNAKTINFKVDSMTMAQEYFKRAIVVVVLCAFDIMFLFLFKSKFDFSFLCSALNNIHINILNTIILYALSLIGIVLGIVAIRKKRK